MSKWPPFCRKLTPWFELTGQGQRQQWDGKHIKDWLGMHQTFHLHINFLSGHWFVRFMISQGGGHRGSWQLTHRFSKYLLWECPSSWDDRPRPVIFEARGWCHGHHLCNRIANTSIMGLFWPKTTPNPTCSSKGMSMNLSMILPCFGFGFNFRFWGNWNHGFDSENFNQNRNQNHGFNFPKMLLTAGILWFQLKIETVVLIKSKPWLKNRFSSSPCPTQMSQKALYQLLQPSRMHVSKFTCSDLKR